MPVSSLSQHAERALDVRRVDVGDEAVLRVVGRRDRGLLVVEPDHRRDRAEDLLAQQLGVRADARPARSARRSSRRRRAPSRRRPPARPCRARRATSSSTLSRCVASISGPTLTSSSVPRPTFIAPSLPASFVGELVRDRAGDVEAVRRRARLAHVAHLRDHRALDGGVDVGVREDDERRVAAELHRRPQQALGGLLDELLPDLGRAGERELAQPRVGDDRLRDLARRRRR